MLVEIYFIFNLVKSKYKILFVLYFLENKLRKNSNQL